MYILCYLFAFLSGLASDSWVSRFWTIFWGYWIYIFWYGLALIVLRGHYFKCGKAADQQPISSQCTGTIVTVLLVTSIGAGMMLIRFFLNWDYRIIPKSIKEVPKTIFSQVVILLKTKKCPCNKKILSIKECQFFLITNLNEAINFIDSYILLF